MRLCEKSRVLFTGDSAESIRDCGRMTTHSEPSVGRGHNFRIADYSGVDAGFVTPRGCPNFS